MKWAGCCQTTLTPSVLPWCGFALVCHPSHLHISKCFIAWVLLVCLRCGTGSPAGRAGPAGPCAPGQGTWHRVCGQLSDVLCFPLLSWPGPWGDQGEPQKECSGAALGSRHLCQPGGGRITTLQCEDSNQACWNQKERKEEKKNKKPQKTPRKQQLFYFSPIFIIYTTNSVMHIDTERIQLLAIL